MTRPVSTVVSAGHPAAWGWFGALLVIGAWSLCVPGGQSKAIDMALPRWCVWIYYGALVVFGIGGLIALSQRHLQKRLHLERVCWYVGYFQGFYSVAAFVSTGLPGGQAALPGSVFVIVATWRILQITAELRRVRRDEEKGLPADPVPLGSANEGMT